MSESKNYFTELNSIDCSGKVEKKNGLSYLSWAWAWGELKKRHPDATYTVYENAQGWNYHTDGRTCWVKVGVTVNGIEHIEYLPVMDNRNRSIPLEQVTSFEVNKSIQRACVKGIARHGVALYLYAGEDLPEGAEPHIDAKAFAMIKAQAKAANISIDEVFERYGLSVSKPSEMTQSQYVDALRWLNEVQNEQAGA